MKSTIYTIIIVFAHLSFYGQIKNINLPKNYCLKDTANKINFYMWEENISKSFNLLKLSEDQNYDKAYRFWSEYQIIEVYLTNNQYSGQIINYAYKSNRSRKKLKKLKFESIPISSDTAFLLIEKFDDIIQVPDQYEIPYWDTNCESGEPTYKIEASTPLNYNLKSFCKPSGQDDTVNYQKDLEIFIDYMLDRTKFYKYRNSFLTNLGPGTYSDGMSFITINKRKTKSKH